MPGGGNPTGLRKRMQAIKEIVMHTGRYARMLLCAVFFLSGCAAVGPDYEKPDMKTADSWFTSENSAKLVDSSRSAQADWWLSLRDPQLAALMEKAAAYNLDARIAEANIREARALRNTVAAGQYPSLAASAAPQRRGFSERGLQQPQPGLRRDQDYYETGFDASWELDIFGRVRRVTEAADARLAGAVEERRDVLLSVFAEIARTYAELRGTQQRAAIMEKNIALQAQTVHIVRQRYTNGDASEFDLTRATAQLRNTEAARPNLTADMRANAHRLSVLTGEEPQALLEELLRPIPPPALPDIIPTGLRSEILRRRPDIRSAERQLAAATADIGVAMADLFPRFFLTGYAGMQSVSFANLFQAGSIAYSLGPSIQWPIFRGGEIRARIQAQEARADAAALRYEKAVLSALEDAETALTRYGEEFETQKRLQKSAAAMRKAVMLARQRYALGEDGILAVVDAERELVQTEDALALSQTRIFTRLVAVYKALGGGWEVFEHQ